jgi:Peptidase M50B-like
VSANGTAGQPAGRAMSPAQQRALAAIRGELGRLARYDDESIVNDLWVRRRYDGGRFANYGEARRATVTTAWHEAGHAVAALAVGARFRSASIHPGRDTEGRVHGIRGTGDLAFVVDAAGQIAERLMAWTMLSDDELREWLPSWRDDGGDAQRFRAAIRQRFGDDEFAAWRYSEEMLVPRRLELRQVARALLVHPRHIPEAVVAALAAGC